MKVMVSLATVALAGVLTVGCSDGEDGKGGHDRAMMANDMAPLVEGLPEDQPLAEESVELNFKLQDDLEALGYVLQGFECRFDADKEFVPCGTDKFHLTGLKAGESYQIEVRAVLKRSSDGLEIRTATVIAAFCKPSRELSAQYKSLI